VAGNFTFNAKSLLQNTANAAKTMRPIWSVSALSSSAVSPLGHALSDHVGLRSSR
jgi:hypothetical protein